MHRVTPQPSQLNSPPVLALAVVIAAAPIVIALYAYVAYPVIIWAVARMRPLGDVGAQSENWPAVTITVPVYNEVSTIRTTLERLLELDYPRDRLQLVVLSDASNDGTDDIVRELAGRGVELIRAPSRRGKTAAENAAVAVARGDIIVNVDATVVIAAGSLKQLIRAFDDSTVGVASGRDVSVDAAGKHEAGAESGYTSYEMLVRDLETRAGSIVGASGCFYGIRRSIRVSPLPSGLSWDFASTLVARQQGYRSVSVPGAVCLVPRTAEIRSELRRKTRTMARGISTLVHFRALMNPFKYGGFALMLISHKLFRWVPYLLVPAAILALGLLATRSSVATILLTIIAFGLLSGAAAIRYGSSITFKPLTLAGFVVAAVSAGFLAWVDALRGTRTVTWDPTPRPTVTHG
jgi:cellulose synthase/poly-beta-1,6-N-acetylglucosamine synthase-like glycosyltransferase